MKFKISFLILIIFIFVLSCEKDRINLSYGYIIAGDRTAVGIVYTDLTDTTIAAFDEMGSHDILQDLIFDINRDGKNDFTLTVRSYGGQSYYRRFSYIKCFNNCEIIMSSEYPKIIELNDTISNDLNFQFKDSCILCYKYWTQGVIDSDDFWNDKTDKYIGYRIMDNVDTLYGWIRLDIIYHATMTIKDYAYRE